MNVYLKFPDRNGAEAALIIEGFEFGRNPDMFSKGIAWGTIFEIPEDSTGYYCNIYDCNELPTNLQQYEVQTPETPYNVRFS